MESIDYTYVLIRASYSTNNHSNSLFRFHNLEEVESECKNDCDFYSEMVLLLFGLRDLSESRSEVFSYSNIRSEPDSTWYEWFKLAEFILGDI